MKICDIDTCAQLKKSGIGNVFYENVLFGRQRKKIETFLADSSVGPTCNLGSLIFRLCVLFYNTSFIDVRRHKVYVY